MKRLLYSTVLLLSMLLSACETDNKKTSSVDKTISTTESLKDGKVETDGQKIDKSNDSTEEDVIKRYKEYNCSERNNISVGYLPNAG